MSDWKTHYMEAHLDDVMAYYAKDFKLPKGQVIEREWWVDVWKGKVMFRITVREEEK